MVPATSHREGTMDSSAFLPVGAATIPLEPIGPVPMSGFAARLEPSVGVADPPPGASAVAFGDLVLVFLDAVGVDPGLADAVRAEGGVREQVWVLATHTHAGPCVLHRGLGERSAAAADALARAGGEAARAALAARTPCALEWFTPQIPGLAFDRRRGVRSEDATLRALRWVDDAGRVRGVLTSYPCHPTSLGPLNRHLSGDYPGFFRRAVERAWGAPCVFATGCAGDLNTGQSAAASFATGGGDTGRTMADSERFGDALAGVLLDGTWTPCADASVAWHSTEVPLRQVPLDADLADLRASWLAEREDADPGVRAVLDCWIDWSHRRDAGRADTLTAPVGWLGVGGVDVYLLPGEPFLAADRALTAEGRALALGYFEDVRGYFPGAGDYALGGYEVIDAHRYYGEPAPFARGSLEALVDAARALAR